MSGGSDPAAWRLSDKLIRKSDRKTTKYERAFEPKKKKHYWRFINLF